MSSTQSKSNAELYKTQQSKSKEKDTFDTNDIPVTDILPSVPVTLINRDHNDTISDQQYPPPTLTPTNCTLEPKKHSFVVGATPFEIDIRYKFIKPMGQGAYGLVIAAENTETNEKVAIKKIHKAFEDVIDAKRILREIKLLQHFDHDNIIAISDLLPPRSVDQFEDIYIVSDLMETDLHRIIYSAQPLTDDHIQYFIYQLLRALKYIHSANVLHRDLKPSNILLNSSCDLKVCDFGLARGIEADLNNMELTEYVVTRWYRAPEIMLSTKEYTKAIDIWSTGCIFAELLSRKPFFPGDDYIHQLQIICDKVGSPEEEDLHFVTSEKARRFMQSQPRKPRIPFSKLFPTAQPLAIDLLEKMLIFNPNKRISVEQALEHPYLESLHLAEDEPISEPFSFAFEQQPLSKHSLQQLIIEEIQKFHPNVRGFQSNTTVKTDGTSSHSVNSDQDISTRDATQPQPILNSPEKDLLNQATEKFT